MHDYCTVDHSPPAGNCKVHDPSCQRHVIVCIAMSFDVVMLSLMLRKPFRLTQSASFVPERDLTAR